MIDKTRFPGTINPDADVDPEDLLDNTPDTAGYTPGAQYGLWSYLSYNRNRPPFTFQTIREMLCDPRIVFGLWLLKGPILSGGEFDVETSNAQVAEFIKSNLRRFWYNSAARVLKALEWGFSASEIRYRYNEEDGAIHFDTVKDLDSLDCRPVTHEGNVCGFTVRSNTAMSGATTDHYSKPWVDRLGSKPPIASGEQIYLGAPRALYHLHSRDRNPWFGLSRLFGVHVPWWEQWSEDGYRAIRRLWFAKNAFEGGVMYHPPGTIATKQGPKPARDYAREMIEKKRSGGVLTLPNTMGPDGSGRAWEYIPPQGNPVPAGLLEYGDLLRDEVLEGLGIPAEVIQSSGETGFGSASGRQVPQMAFYSVLLELKQWLALDFDLYCLRYLVHLNFGNVQYELIPLPLDNTAEPPPEDPNNPDNPLAQEEGNPDAQEAKDYENSKGETLKKKASSSNTPPGFGMSHWVTIGGHEEGSEEHAGGTPVMIGEGGKILAGGPPKFRGQNVSEIGKSRRGGGGWKPKDRKAGEAGVGQSKPPRTYPSRSTDTPEDDSFDFGANSKSRSDRKLPHPVDPLSSALEEHAGKNLDHQQGFLNYAKEAHKEHQKARKSIAKGEALMKEFQSLEHGREVKRTRNGKTTIYQQKAQPYADTLEAAAKRIEKSTGIPADKFQEHAKDLWESEYGPEFELEQTKTALRKTFYSFMSMNAGNVSLMENQGSEVANFSRFDEFVSNAHSEFPSLVPDPTDDPQAAEDAVLKIIKSPPKQIPKATNHAFLAEAIGSYLDQVDQEDYPVHHPKIMERAHQKIHQDTMASRSNKFV